MDKSWDELEAEAFAAIDGQGVPARNMDANDVEREHGLEGVEAAFDARGRPAPTRAAIVEADDFPLEVLQPCRWQDWQDDGPPARQWALTDWLPLKQATYLTGPGSAGKSLLAQQLCTCIALGLPFMGIPTEARASLYLTCEDDPDEMMRRQVAICDALGVRMSDTEGKLFLTSWGNCIDPALVRATADGRIERTENFAALRDGARQARMGFLSLDNVAHLFAGNENSRHEVATFVMAMNSLAAELAGSVLFLGHPNKAGAEFSGSTAWENQVRSRIHLECPQGEEGDVSDPDLRVLSRSKANYARNGEKLIFRWHKWAFVRPEDLPGNIGEELAATILANNENAAFLACLDERNRQRRPVSELKAAPSYAPREFERMPEARGMKRKALEATMDRLFRSNQIERGFLWRDTKEGKDREGLRRAGEEPR